MKKRTTIGDVAQLARVSTATVSRAMQSPEKVSDSTLKAIQAAIDKTGYTINRAAKMLRQNKANAALIIVPNIGNSFFSEILAGAERAATENNMTILIGDSGDDDSHGVRLFDGLTNGQADGALLLSGHIPQRVQDRMRLSPDLYGPIVSISEALETPIVPHFGIDNIEAAAAATRFLIEKGHRDICHLHGPLENILTQQRLSGFRSVIADHDLPGHQNYEIPGDFSVESGIAAAKDIARLLPRPTAVFCANDEMAIGLISGLYGLGIKVPKDISIIGFDDISFAKASVPTLTTVRQPRFDFGYLAMRHLISLINGEMNGDAQKMLLNVELVERQSVTICKRQL